jgi:hypothetical protein
MSLPNYFSEKNSMQKTECCPESCEMRSLSKIPPVWVPPPQPPDRVRGVIISRDPTTEYIPYFTSASEEPYPEWRTRLFRSNAIPNWIFKRISAFNQKFISPPIPPEDLEKFRLALFDHTYWTHLHKCCTDKQGEKSEIFKTKNARLCADTWLRAELEAVNQDNAPFVIALGKDVERWVRAWHAEGANGDTMQIFYLPHPSTANMASWHPKSESARNELEMKIRRLIELC